MATTLADLRAAIATRLASLTGWQVSAYMLANPTPPAIHVVPGPVSYDRAMSRGLDEWTLLVQAMVPLIMDRASQETLDALIDGSGSASVKALIEGDRTLGGKAQDLRVTEATGYRTASFEGRGSVLTVEWTVQVFALGE